MKKLFIFLLLLLVSAGVYAYFGNWGNLPVVRDAINEQVKAELNASFAYREVQGNPFRGLEFARPVFSSGSPEQWRLEGEKFIWKRIPRGILWLVPKGSLVFSRSEEGTWSLPSVKKYRTLSLPSLSFQFTDVAQRYKKRLTYSGEFSGIIRFTPGEVEFPSFSLQVKPLMKPEEQKEEKESEKPPMLIPGLYLRPEGQSPFAPMQKMEEKWQPITMSVSGKGSYNPDNHNYSLALEYSLFSLKSWFPYLLVYTGLKYSTPGEAVLSGTVRIQRMTGVTRMQGAFTSPSAFLFGQKLENLAGEFIYEPFHLKMKEGKATQNGASVLAYDTDIRLIYERNQPRLVSSTGLSWANLPSSELLKLLPYSFRLPIQNDKTRGDLKWQNFLAEAPEEMKVKGVIISEYGTVQIYQNSVPYVKIELPIEWEKGILKVSRGHFIAMDGQWVGVGKIRYDWNNKEIRATAFFAIPPSALPMLTAESPLGKAIGEAKETSLIVVGHAFGTAGKVQSGFSLPGRFLIRFSSSNPEKRLEELWKQYVMSEWSTKV